MKKIVISLSFLLVLGYAGRVRAMDYNQFIPGGPALTTMGSLGAGLIASPMSTMSGRLFSKAGAGMRQASGVQQLPYIAGAGGLMAGSGAALMLLISNLVASLGVVNKSMADGFYAAFLEVLKYQGVNAALLFSINFLSQLIEGLQDGPLKKKLQQIAWYLSHASSGISAGIYHYLMPRALSGYAH